MIVTQILTWLTFGCVFGMLVYAWRQYLLPYFHLEHKAQIKKQQELEKNLAYLHREAARSENDSLKQAIQRERLVEQVTTWAEQVEETRLRESQQREKAEEKICHTLKGQYERVRRRCLRRRVLPLALQQVEHELKETYANDPQQAHEFVEQICAEICGGKHE